MLSYANVRTLKGLLHNRKQDLLRIVEGAGNEDVDRNSVVDRKDLADEAMSAEVDEAEVARAFAELRQIDGADQRLQAGTYGRCEQCGEEIDLRRLMLQPAASRCQACASEREGRTRAATSR